MKQVLVFLAVFALRFSCGYIVPRSAVFDVVEPVPQDCPHSDGSNPTYFPAINCSKFWECSNGEPFIFNCPPHLEFDPVDHICKNPMLANCTGQGWSTTDSPTETTTSATVTSSDSSDSSNSNSCSNLMNYVAITDRKVRSIQKMVTGFVGSKEGPIDIDELYRRISSKSVDTIK